MMFFYKKQNGLFVFLYISKKLITDFQYEKLSGNTILLFIINHILEMVYK